MMTGLLLKHSLLLLIYVYRHMEVQCKVTVTMVIPSSHPVFMGHTNGYFKYYARQDREDMLPEVGDPPSYACYRQAC